MTHDPFDHTRDASLGAALRAHFAPEGHAAFVARVRAGIAAAEPNPFEILGAWMRPGIAAAALIAAAAGWWLTNGPATETPSGTPVEVFAVGGGTDVIMASAVEGR